jgi:hypothetical protein
VGGDDVKAEAAGIAVGDRCDRIVDMKVGSTDFSTSRIGGVLSSTLRLIERNCAMSMSPVCAAALLKR